MLLALRNILQSASGVSQFLLFFGSGSNYCEVALTVIPEFSVDTEKIRPRLDKRVPRSSRNTVGRRLQSDIFIAA